MSYPRRLLLLFMATAIVLLISFAVLFGVGVITLFENRLMQQHEAEANQLTLTLATFTEAQAAQRGFILTGDSHSLEPYQATIARIHGQLAVLAGDAEKRHLNAQDVKTLQGLAAEKLAELQQEIDIRQNAGIDAAIAAVKSNDGDQKMSALRVRISQMVDHEHARVDAARTVAQRSVTARGRLFLIIALVNLVFLGWTYHRLKKEAAARQIAALDVQRQKDLLAVTLGSIGDAVIVTDPRAKITYMNEVAEGLTGWKLADALAQPCVEVFRIVNEETRGPVESPVEKVLRQGVIVGLANHTLLLCRDGREVPIDDSGAPIRDRDGTIRGVVLIFRDFSKHKDAERTLRAAKQELEAASKAKDQFLASLSHELRTPLTPVLAVLTAWETEGRIPAAFLSDVQMLRRNVELEARLIDDLLDLTRIAKGKLALNRQIADVHELVQAAAKICDAEIKAKRIDLSISLGAAQYHANVDPARLQQVFWNVFKNATKFTPEAGEIRVRTSNDADGRLCIAVSDTGIGMSPEILNRVFQPFDQGPQDITRRFGGLGLGMAITKALLDAQEGQIAAQSAGEGRGSTFTISLQTASQPAIASRPMPVAPQSGPKERRSLRILLVEDHEDTATVLGRVLRGSGHEVHISESVASAAQTADTQEFDLLLSDIGLPDGTGIDLIRQIRRRYQMPAIALTGYGMEEDIVRCREAGFTAHLTKPVSFQKLEVLIGQVTAAGNA